MNIDIVTYPWLEQQILPPALFPQEIYPLQPVHLQSKEKIMFGAVLSPCNNGMKGGLLVCALNSENNTF